ncbi:MAG: hypothetical protein HW386_1057, partial [Gammaproteobacteria bacterium]|nr:hypothetical protein [Gammaproteobacteria bacterium]
DAPQEQVFAAERAFANTMAERDLQAFSDFVSEEAIFFSSEVPLGDFSGSEPNGTYLIFLGWPCNLISSLASGRGFISSG